ncbi:MAG: glycosyltransferase [Bacteroidetes bacterium]|nr:MAG: glycosyltransferase [Bacteroidota bacterium]
MNQNNTLLIESSWEVCNQVGGIYTVLRSKVPSMMEKWKDNYLLMGPYFPSSANPVFDRTEEDTDDSVMQVVLKMRQMGYEVFYGRWLVTGRPRTILFNPYSVYGRLSEIKYELWDHHGIPSPATDELHNQVVAFGYLMKVFLGLFSQIEAQNGTKIVAHFHEWMAATPIPAIRREQMPIRTVFTTHATLLGRYLAMNDPQFYDHLPFVDWLKEAKYFNIEPAVRIERTAALASDCFTTVSQVTGKECTHLLGRTPDVMLPNGLNIQRFTALHEFQNLHLQYKEEINEFVMGHFFQSYSFDLDNTLYFFTSGRYEYSNKGFDLTLEALARLNWRLKQENSPITIVMFFITKKPFKSINPQVLQSRGVMEEIRQCCSEIRKQVGNKLFYAAAVGDGQKMPDLSEFVDDYWKLRLRRTIQSWKSKQLPSVITHNLEDDSTDEILAFLRNSGLVNKPDDRVKIVYHPDFIAPTNPLFGIEYGQFVRGCHLGVFPSYYEPWGYTPLECIASGVPALTSDLAGFGDYVLQTIPDHDHRGIFVVNRRSKDYESAAIQLSAYMYNFIQQNRRDRITQRNRVEASAEIFDWKQLRVHYDKAHEMALK